MTGERHRLIKTSRMSTTVLIPTRCSFSSAKTLNFVWSRGGSHSSPSALISSLHLFSDLHTHFENKLCLQSWTLFLSELLNSTYLCKIQSAVLGPSNGQNLNIPWGIPVNAQEEPTRSFPSVSNIQLGFYYV